jgi:NAD(P)-dependent dehydrogenase (short-subunit alcohol dehydrogenase family)
MASTGGKRVALVTGAARGIGLGIAKCLAKEGCDLAINDVADEPAAAAALAEVGQHGAAVLYCRADVSDPAARTAMLDAIRDRFGRLDVLVNNAGVAPLVRADLLEASEESFERLMRINLQGPYFLTQAAARWMIQQQDVSGTLRVPPGYPLAGDGTPTNAAHRCPVPDTFRCIVNISSISASVASPSRGEYCISKAGVSMATKLWAARLSEFGIGVYEIRPGIIKTDMTAPVTAKYDKLISEGLCLQPRWGMPADIGRAVAMLVRGDLGYSTGQVILVDGGMTVQRL